MFIVTGNSCNKTTVSAFSFSPAFNPLFIIFPLVCTPFFNTALLMHETFYKTSGGIFSMAHTLQEYSKQALSIQYNTFHKHIDTIWSQHVIRGNYQVPIPATRISVAVIEAQCWLLNIWKTIYFPVPRDTANLPPIHELPVLTLKSSSFTHCIFICSIHP